MAASAATLARAASMDSSSAGGIGISPIGHHTGNGLSAHTWLSVRPAPVAWAQAAATPATARS